MSVPPSFVPTALVTCSSSEPPNDLLKAISPLNFISGSAIISSSFLEHAVNIETETNNSINFFILQLILRCSID